MDFEMVEQKINNFDFKGNALKERDILKHLEKIGRVCYKSENKITADSCIKFIKNIIKRKHYSVLEHFNINIQIYNYFSNMQIFEKEKYFHVNNKKVSANIRAWRDFFIKYPKMSNLLYHFKNNFPTLFNDLKLKKNPFGLFTKNYKFSFIGAFDFGSLLKTYKIITSRAIANQIVRHRVLSFAQESTRYCNYLKSKLQFVKNNELEKKYYCSTFFTASENYLKAVKDGVKPENARGLLPLDLKTEIVVTGTLQNWQPFLKERLSNGAQKGIKEIATYINNENKNFLLVL